MAIDPGTDAPTGSPDGDGELVQPDPESAEFDVDAAGDGGDEGDGAVDAIERRRRSAGSRRRVKQAALVVGVAVLAAAGGAVFGSRLKSPGDAASEREAPAASRITVPVEMRRLVSTLIVSGETRYVEPTTVRLAGGVGTSGGDRQVVTRLPELGTEIVEGALLLEVSGRPVFAMHGELPMYRQLTPGAVGPDVLQLETALETLGFSPGTVDDVFDAGTEAALDGFYTSRGYASEGPNDTDRRALNDARRAVSESQEALRRANIDLSNGTTTVSEAERLAARQTLDRAEAAVPEARTQAQRANEQAARTAGTAIANRDNAAAVRDAQQRIYDAAAVPGAINPDTGSAYTAVELAMIQQELATLQQAFVEADNAAAQAVADQQAQAERGAADIRAAEDALALARAQFNELGKPSDTTALRDAVTAAEQQVADATAALAELEAEIGTIVPAGEVVFLPVLPTTITTLNAQLGAEPPTDFVAQVSSTDTEIIGRVSKADANLITVGTPVVIEMRDVGIETTGVLTDVRAPTQDPNAGGPELGPSPGGGSGDSDRLEVVVAADDTSQLREFIGWPVRINVTVSATDDEVLAVPVAAISVGPDGTSRVEVERERARGTRPGRTELVEVTVGLAAQGYAEVSPVGGASLVEGDRVVVGSDTGERQNRRQRASDRAGDESGDDSGASG